MDRAQITEKAFSRKGNLGIRVRSGKKGSIRRSNEKRAGTQTGGGARAWKSREGGDKQQSQKRGKGGRGFERCGERRRRIV